MIMLYKHLIMLQSMISDQIMINPDFFSQFIVTWYCCNGT